MKTKKTIAIINDPKVTLGSLSDNKIEKKYAWEVNWNSLSEDDQYIILGGHMGAYNIDAYPYLIKEKEWLNNCLLYTSPSPRDKRQSRMPSSA